ncbi:Vesicular inhibitory amino acid transporter [Holothuria leucospilota]|uniref:Vesicular inhibitory amino acid transporter n=1 Tax=Holothuria leucospilota TaxID=206669 RepID=A0A9Q1H5R5_HOLLE|nr:Vesicular inhibitory amino acid transporter [Holothuria leucospilota]
MFLVALPFAVLHGGYWTLLAIIVAAIITCYTGIILVECLYETNPITGQRMRVRDTYVSIAREVWGARFAARIVHTAQFIELIMTCILYLVLCGDMMYNTFGFMSESAWTSVAAFFVVPCAFLRDLKAVSRLSFGNAVAHVVINVAVVGFCVTLISNWHWSATPVLINIHHFPVSIGIIVFSYTSHIFLPSLEGSMTHRKNFRKMLYWTHGLAGLFKALFAYICFLTFASATEEVITDNLPTQGFKDLVSLCLVAKALLSYPLPYFAAAELLERAFFQGRPETVWPSCYAFDGMLHTWAVTLRVFLVVFSLILAVIIPHFALLMGLIGSFTGTMLSFVWPCWFHLKIRWDDLRWYIKVLDIAIICSGLLCCCVGIVFSSASLIAAYHEDT